MSNTYFRFQRRAAGASKSPESISKRLIQPMLNEPAPVSNPDFVTQIPSVAIWLIEFEDDSYYPNREIGLDKNGTPIMIMPWKSNYGYWTDSNIVLKDLQANFEVEPIDKSTFKGHWNAFEERFGKG